jgi:general secretion pathway protein D
MRRTLVAVLLPIAFLAVRVPEASAQPPIQQTQGGITLNFQDVDLSYVIGALAQAAGLNVVTSNLPEVQVTVRTVTPITIENVLGLIRDLAASHGVSVTQANGFLRLSGQGEDVPPEPRSLHIHKLRHARAPILAATLQSLFSGVIQQAQAGQRGGNLLSAQLQVLQAQAQAAAGRGGRGAQQAFLAGGISGNVSIVPDEVTNSLLIYATDADWQVIQQALQSLDLRPLQVVIEVVIAEVRRANDLNVGMSFVATDDDVETEAALPSAISEQDFTFSFIRTGDVNIEATLSAFASTGNVRILSRPLIQAQNNQEAQISVGEQRPFISSSTTLPTDQLNQVQTVQYRDVATSLNITPTINDEGYVNMAVSQDVSSATAELQFGAPVISNRAALTQLLARHGQTVVIGGLIDRHEEKSRSGIPFLKDIPILGFLFGTTRSNVVTSELFLFLTPYIVASDADADRVREEIENRVELLRGIVPVPPMAPPVIRLPPPDTTGAPPDTTGAAGATPPDTTAGRGGRGGRGGGGGGRF